MIDTISLISIIIVTLLHLVFMILEMFFWKSDSGRKIFGTTREFANQSATLAANQGLYNGFLAAGLILGLITGNTAILYFILICIIIAGIYGALTAKAVIFFIQALPALIALGLLYLKT